MLDNYKTAEKFTPKPYSDERIAKDNSINLLDLHGGMRSAAPREVNPNFMDIYPLATVQGTHLQMHELKGLREESPTAQSKELYELEKAPIENNCIHFYKLFKSVGRKRGGAN